jgi:dGTP triphosphohydrolase
MVIGQFAFDSRQKVCFRFEGNGQELRVSTSLVECFASPLMKKTARMSSEFERRKVAVPEKEQMVRGPKPIFIRFRSIIPISTAGLKRGAGLSSSISDLMYMTIILTTRNENQSKKFFISDPIILNVKFMSSLKFECSTQLNVLATNYSGRQRLCRLILCSLGIIYNAAHISK